MGEYIVLNCLRPTKDHHGYDPLKAFEQLLEPVINWEQSKFDKNVKEDDIAYIWMTGEQRLICKCKIIEVGLETKDIDDWDFVYILRKKTDEKHDQYMKKEGPYVKLEKINEFHTDLFGINKLRDNPLLEIGKMVRTDMSLDNKPYLKAYINIVENLFDKEYIEAVTNDYKESQRFVHNIIEAYGDIKEADGESYTDNLSIDDINLIYNACIIGAEGIETLFDSSCLTLERDDQKLVFYGIEGGKKYSVKKNNVKSLASRSPVKFSDPKGVAGKFVDFLVELLGCEERSEDYYEYVYNNKEIMDGVKELGNACYSLILSTLMPEEFVYFHEKNRGYRFLGIDIDEEVDRFTYTECCERAKTFRNENFPDVKNFRVFEEVFDEYSNYIRKAMQKEHTLTIERNEGEGVFSTIKESLDDIVTIEIDGEKKDIGTVESIKEDYDYCEAYFIDGNPEENNPDSTNRTSEITKNYLAKLTWGKYKERIKALGNGQEEKIPVYRETEKFNGIYKKKSKPSNYNNNIISLDDEYLIYDGPSAFPALRFACACLYLWGKEGDKIVLKYKDKDKEDKIDKYQRAANGIREFLKKPEGKKILAQCIEDEKKAIERYKKNDDEKREAFLRKFGIENLKKMVEDNMSDELLDIFRENPDWDPCSNDASLYQQLKSGRFDEYANTRGSTQKEFLINEKEGIWKKSNGLKLEEISKDPEISKKIALEKAKEIINAMINTQKDIDAIDEKGIESLYDFERLGEQYEKEEKRAKNTNAFEVDNIKRFKWFYKYFTIVNNEKFVPIYNEGLLKGCLENLEIPPLTTIFGCSRQLSIIQQEVGLSAREWNALYGKPVFKAYIRGWFDKSENNGNESQYYNKNIVFYGPPGTGKTRQAKIEAATLLGLDVEKLETSDRFKLVQFHPSYSYNDFMETIDIAKEDGPGIKDQVFKEFANVAKENAEKALENDVEPNPYVLIIDEINRANASEVLGELLYAIEYRGENITTSIKNEEFYVPDNLYIFGTMNTADRSLQNLDYAVRRRFDFVEVVSKKPKPLNEKEINEEFYEMSGKNKANEAQFFMNAAYDRVCKYVDVSVARGVEAKSIMPGISYFIVNEGENGGPDNDHFDYKLKYELIPLLQEYVKDGLFTNMKKEIECDDGKKVSLPEYLRDEPCKKIIKGLLSSEG